MKSYKIYIKDYPPIIIKEANLGKIMEGMVVFHDKNGAVTASFTVGSFSSLQ